MEAAQLNTQPSSGSDAWMAGLPTSHQTSSLFQKVMAQRSVQIEAAQAAKEVRRAIQRPKGLTFMKVGKPAEAGTLKGFAKEIGVSYQGNKETVLCRRSVGGWRRPAAHLSLLLGDRVRLGCIALEQDRRPGRRHF